MNQLLKALPILAALVAAPAWAAQPDSHAGHHPAEAADAVKPAPKPDATPGMHACPMMDGKMASVAGAPDGKAPKDKAPDSKMMMGGKDMPCMPAPSAAKTEEPSPDHDHPEAAPKWPQGTAMTTCKTAAEGRQLDEALADTFPASDPVSLSEPAGDVRNAAGCCCAPEESGRTGPAPVSQVRPSRCCGGS